MSAIDPRALFYVEGSERVGVRNQSGEANVKISLATDATVLRLIPFRNKQEMIEAALARFRFQHLPAPGNYTRAGQYRLAWAGRNCWHMICSPATATLEQELTEALVGLAAISDASDGLLRLEIAGKNAVKLMTKGCVLDLDSFQPGHCAVTLMAHTRLHIHRVSDTGFELMIPASYAASFCEWLRISAAEFEPDIDPAFG
ncbi:MAG: sarcosine oxidase subunit gamma family protein [Pseudomonadota bacterium]